MDRNTRSFPKRRLLLGLISICLVVIVVVGVVFFFPELPHGQSGTVTPTARSVTATPSLQTSSTPVDSTSITDVNLLQGALGELTGQQAQLLQAIINQVHAYPPASEPAFVSMLQTLAGSGNAPSSYVDTITGGRGDAWSSSSSTLNVPAGYQALGSIAISPLILDMSGTGIPDVANHTVNPHPFSFSQARTTLFDMNADGYADFTEWVGPQAALLVHPVTAKVTSENGQLVWNGPISGADLLGTVGGYQNGFEHLSTFDTNGDGVIEGNELNQLYAWIDSNGNGKVDPGELHTLQSLGIQSLNIQHSGNTGSYVKNGKTLPMWDWWPTFIQVMPSLSQSLPSNASSPVCSDTTISLQGHLPSQQPPDLSGTISSSKTNTTWSIPIATLEQFGFNPDAGLLARVAPAGNTIVLIDYRAQPPHTARVWLLTRSAANTWKLTRFSLPEASVEQVTFDASGSTLFLLARNQTQPYVIQGLAMANTSAGQPGAFHPTLSSLAWDTPGTGFRVLWGTPISQGENYYLPGYFQSASGVPLCESLAQLTIAGKKVALRPFSDIHWLDGDELPTHGYLKPFLYFLASPDLSYAAVRNANGGVTLLALSGRQASGGKIISLDTMDAIGGLSANATSVEYLARQASGAWEVRWIDIAHTGQANRATLPLASLPSYPELAANGTQAMWGVFDWTHGTTALWRLQASNTGAKPQQLFSFNSITGSIRVASTASLMAVQTATNIVVWSAP